MTPPPPPPPPDATAAGLPGPPTARAGRLRRPAASILADRAYLAVTLLASLVAVAAIAYLIYKTVAETGEVWSTFGVWGFITGTEWVPTPAQGDPVFGALPFIYGTLMTSFIALLLAVPASIGIALATTVFLPRRIRGLLGGLINLLAAIPSVVFGLWGVSVLVPWATPALEWIAGTFGGVSLLGWEPFAGPVTSGSYLIAGLVLGVMVLPVITAIVREVLLTVPLDQVEGAYALGATRWEMVRDAMLPWARSGIVGASALGLGRAVGETIAIAMLLGNSPDIFSSLLGPGSTLAGVIALETGEAGDLQLASLTALAVVLFVLAFVINAAARLLVGRSSSGPGLFRRALGWVPFRSWRPPPEDLPEAHMAAGGPAEPQGQGRPRPRELPPMGEQVTVQVTGPGAVSRSRRVRSRIAETFVWLSLLVGLVPLVAVLVEMVRKGLPAIGIDFFTELPPTDITSTAGGISNALVGTLILMGIALLVAAPLGILTALFISDVASSGRWYARVGQAVGFFVDVLLGVPSIVAGLIVYLGIVVVQGHFSAMAGGIALGIIAFPIIVRAADEILRLVPTAHKEAALALGAPKWRTTWSVVLPAAAPGILTGVLLALARVSGETAPLLFTSLGNQFFSTSLSEPIAAIPQFIFTNTVISQTEASLQLAWGAALVLVGIILLLNLVAALIARTTRATEKR